MQHSTNCICVDCTHKCSEYYNNATCDKAYYEWCIKQEKCEKEAHNVRKAVYTIIKRRWVFPDTSQRKILRVLRYWGNLTEDEGTLRQRLHPAV